MASYIQGQGDNFLEGEFGPETGAPVQLLGPSGPEVGGGSERSWLEFHAPLAGAGVGAISRWFLLSPSDLWRCSWRLVPSSSTTKRRRRDLNSDQRPPVGKTQKWSLGAPGPSQAY